MSAAAQPPARPPAAAPPARRPAAVLFDMDGTLVDTEVLWDRSLADVAAELGGTLSPQARAGMVGGVLASSVATLIAETGRPDADPDVVAERLLDRTAELFAAHTRVRPGAARLLAEIRAAGLPVALVTSTFRRLVEVVLPVLGATTFDVVVCGDEVSCAKPHPEPYLTAARLLGVDVSACVAVEDSVTGAASAEAAGCAVVVVPDQVPVPGGPRRVHVDSLAEVDLAFLRAHPALAVPAARAIQDRRGAPAAREAGA